MASPASTHEWAKGPTKIHRTRISFSISVLVSVSLLMEPTVTTQLTHHMLLDYSMVAEGDSYLPNLPVW